jgi:glycosyltransferase involved in cell wall biosynthesis
VKNKFNYIITCHNKEALIEIVLLSIIYVSSNDSKIYLVLDGCSDNTESNADKVILKYNERKITKLYANDVHELRAINVALRAIDLNENAINIVVQDDVILLDNQLESKVDALYSFFSGKLGIVSFRHGANISKFKLKWNNVFLYPMVDYVHTIFGHGDKDKKLIEGQFTERHIAIKSPICIPNSYIRELGVCNEQFSPWDDFEYCVRGIINGYINGVFSINYYSHVNWGTMRNLEQKIAHNTIVKKNIQLLKEKYLSMLPIPIKNNLYSLVKKDGIWVFNLKL